MIEILLILLYFYIVGLIAAKYKKK